MAYGIPLDKAELLSVLLEGVLYGFSLLMFGATIWVLFSLRSVDHVNRPMLVVACLLLFFSTVHFAINIIRLVEGFAMNIETTPEGPRGFFEDVSQWTFVYMNYVFAAQTLLGDAVVLYRCYVVWQSKLVMVFPVLLWCGVAVTGIEVPYTSAHVHQQEVFGGQLAMWITAFWLTALSTNVVTTSLLAYRIWHVDRMTTGARGFEKSQLRPLMYIIIDAGMIYSLTLFVELLCFLGQSNFQYVLLPMVTPIISITFYMVIIRVGLVNRVKSTPNIPLTPMDASVSGERRPGMRVRITTLTECMVDHGRQISRTTGDGASHVGQDNWKSIGLAM